MRLWSLHPKYLDVRGLTACWREGLLARKVLAGGTTGYRCHPQLARFRALSDPMGAIDSYLEAVCNEAVWRGYRFDRAKIGMPAVGLWVPVSRGQLQYEKEHLLQKLSLRDTERGCWLEHIAEVEPHPLFVVTDGEIEYWEKI